MSVVFAVQLELAAAQAVVVPARGQRVRRDDDGREERVVDPVNVAR